MSTYTPPADAGTVERFVFGLLVALTDLAILVLVFAAFLAGLWGLTYVAGLGFSSGFGP